MSRLNEFPEYTDRVLGGLTAGDDLKHRILVKALETEPRKASFRSSFRAVPAMVCILVMMVAGLGVLGWNRIPDLEEPVLNTTAAGVRTNMIQSQSGGVRPRASVSNRSDELPETDAEEAADMVMTAAYIEEAAEADLATDAEEAAEYAEAEMTSEDAAEVFAAMESADGDQAVSPMNSVPGPTAGAGFAWDLDEDGNPRFLIWNHDCYVLTKEAPGDVSALRKQQLIGGVQKTDASLNQDNAPAEGLFSNYFPEGTEVYRGSEEGVLLILLDQETLQLRKVPQDLIAR